MRTEGARLLSAYEGETVIDLIPGDVQLQTDLVIVAVPFLGMGVSRSGHGDVDVDCLLRLYSDLSDGRERAAGPAMLTPRGERRQM